MDGKMKRYHTSVDPALGILYPRIYYLSRNTDLEDLIRDVCRGLKLIRMFFWGFAFSQELLEPDWMLRLTFMALQFKRKTEEFKSQFEAGVVPLKPLNDLQGMILEHISEATEICNVLLQDTEFQWEHHPIRLQLPSDVEGRQTLGFIDLILENVCALTGGIIPVERQIDFIRRKLKLFLNFVLILLNKGPDGFMRTEQLLCHIQTWATHISSLVFFYWIYEVDEELASEMETRLCNLMRKSTLYHPETIGLFLDVLKAIEYHTFEGTWCPWQLEGYVGFLLEHVVETYVSNDIENLREGLMFLLSFVMDSPKEGSEERNLILAEINVIISEVPFIISNPGNNELSSFLHKIERAKDEVRKLYVVSPLSPEFSSPRTNAIRFLDSLIDTLQNMLEAGVDIIPSMKKQVLQVHQGLESLRPILQTENIKLEDLWTQIVNVIHYATYVTKLCPSTNPSVWYAIVFLQNTLNDINHLWCEVSKIQDDLHINLREKHNTQMTSSNDLVATSKRESKFIGFEAEIQSILERLLGEPKDLTLIFISGMAGQGKTMLARHIYEDPDLRYHFQKTGWCYVSYKGRETRNSLLKILQENDGHVDCNLQIPDIVERLRKTLKEKRYFIVLDDVWDVDAWSQVKLAFPDDKNGSRMLFTSQNQDLARECQVPVSNTYPLRFYTIGESWKLMTDKIPHCEDLSPQLEEVGFQIAGYCRGLPLAVAVIASYLNRIARELETWKEVAKNMKSHLKIGGCMHVLEISYKLLPHDLKLCFLCLAVFEKGSIINVKNLIRFWIAQGFMEESEMDKSKELAYNYLDRLISQNLVIVYARGSMGKIQSCYVHDLIYDLCVHKAAKEDAFLRWVNPNAILDETCDLSLHNHHYIWLSIGDCDLASTSSTSSHQSSQSAAKAPTQVCSLLWSSRVAEPIQYTSLTSFLGRFSVLTRCDMRNVYLECYSFPDAILHNIHLRYLALRGSFSQIPPSIANLWNLETLILYSGRSYISVPDILWKMKSLSSVSIGDFHLDTHAFEHSLSTTAAACNIEKLSEIRICDPHRTGEFLARLMRLKKLKCFYCKQFRPKSLSVFASLEKLEKLTIRMCCKNPPPPDWRNIHLAFPCTLKKLSLTRLDLPWSAMSTVGKLPNLQVLRLHRNACKGITWDLRDEEFLQLKFLLLSQMNVQKINDSNCSDNPFPSLEKLYLTHCTSLEDIPSRFGKLCSLNKVFVNASAKAYNSVKMIVEQQREEMGNDDLRFSYSEHCRYSENHTSDGVYDDETDDDESIPTLEASAAPNE